MRNSRNRGTRLLILAAATAGVVSVGASHAVAASATWTGSTDGTWVTGGNWTPAAAPGSTAVLNSADIATFNNNVNTTITIDLNRNIRSVNFDTAAAAFTIGSAGVNAGNSLLLASAGQISILSTFAGTNTTETINAPLVLEPATSTTAGTYTFRNDSAVTNALNIAGNISAGTTTGVGALGRVTLNLGGTNTNVNNVVSGVISDGGAASGLVINRNGNTAGSVWSITGTNNSFTGGLTLTQGILRVSTISNSGSNSSIGAGGGIIVNTTSGGNNTLVITGAGGSTDRAITITRSGASNNGLVIDSSGSGGVTFSGTVTSSSGGAASTTTLNLLTLQGSTNGNTMSGIISDFDANHIVGVTKTGANTWELTNTNTYSGTTTISGGTLQSAVAVQGFGTNASIAINNGGTLALRSNTSTSFTNGSSAYNLTLPSGNTSETIDVGQVSGSNSGRTITLGNVTLNSANNNVTTLNVTDSVGSGDTLALGAVTTALQSALTLNPTTASLTVASFSRTGGINGSSLTLGGTSTGNTIGAITQTTANPDNVILVKSGASTWTVSGASNYLGSTTVSGGTLAGIGTNAFGSTNGINVGSGTLSLRGDSNTNFVKASDSSLYAVTTTVGSGASTIDVDQATVTGTAAKTMTIGTLTLNTAITNATTFTGANNTSLSIGAVTTGNSANGTETLTNNIGGGGSLTLASISVLRTGTTPTLVFNGSGNTTVTGAITQSGATALTYSGAGTLTLSGSDNHSGTTTVSSGTLLRNGAHTGAGAYIVATGAILGGSGSITTAGNAGIAGSVAATTAWKLSPGDVGAIGTLTTDLGTGQLDIRGAVNASNSQSMLFDIGATGDKVILSGTTVLNIGTGTLEFNDFLFTDKGNIAVGTYTLFDSSSAITGTLGATLTGSFGVGSVITGTIAFANSSQDIVLNVTAAPEPTSLGLIGLGGMALLRRRRRA